MGGISAARLSPGDGSGDRPLHFRPRGQQPSPYGLVQSCAPRRPGPWAGQGRGDESKSGGWAADPHSHPEVALPVPLAGAGPPSQVSATSGRCAAESVFGLRRLRRRTGGRANRAEPDRRCRSQDSPTAGGEGAAWRAPASGPLQIAPSPLCALLRSAADPKCCSHLRSELCTWKIDTRRARASHWSQPPAGSGLGASSGGGGRERVLRLSITGHALPQATSHYGPARWRGGILERHAENLAPPRKILLAGRPWEAITNSQLERTMGPVGAERTPPAAAGANREEEQRSAS